MAIIENDKSDFAAFGAKQAQPTVDNTVNVNRQQQPQQQFNTNDVTPEKYRGKGLLSLAQRSVNYNPLGMKVESFYKEFENILNSHTVLNPSAQRFVLTTFDGATHRVNAGGILLSLVTDKFVVVYPWLIADASELPDKVFTWQGNTISIPQLTEELMTSAVAVPQAIRRYAEQTFPGKDIIMTDGIVLPAILEATNTSQLQRIFDRAVDALEFTRDILTGNEHRFTILAKGNDEKLVLRQEYRAGTASTATGLPVRNDMVVRMFVNSVKNNAQNAVNLGENESAPFSTLRLHMELMYTGDQNPVMSQFGQPIQRPLFQPYMIINATDNQFFGATLETLLLALSTAGSVISNGSWVQCFKPDYSLKIGEDPRDIGAITIDANFPGEELGISDTKEAGFNLYAFMQRYVEQSPIVQIDIPELGELTYLQRPFLEAAGLTGNAEVTQEAYNTIVDAANFLTNGEFAQLWNSNEPIVVPQVGRYELGYFTDEKGVLHDLHELDYLYFLNKCDVNAAREYMDSITPSFAHETIRFDMRRRLYDVWAPGYVITGFAQRLTINPRFLIALSNAIANVGGAPEIETYFHSDRAVERGYRNNILGVNMNDLGNAYGQGGFGYRGNQQPGHWRQYQANGYYR